ncbi:MAG: hypothetical protein M1815_003296 [Lichina confinis]|nr:MAG: hypothetical protein M1815_003296 [Lichina confinis]
MKETKATTMAAPSPNHLTVDPERTAADSTATSVTGDAALPEKGGIEQAPEAPPRATGIRWFLIVLAILSSTFLFALDNTIVADVQPQIVARFASIEKLPWLSVAFLLGAVATNLIWGKIYGQFNAKWMYIISFFLFEVGSAVCGAAPSMDALIIGRAIAGWGGAGMYVGVLTLLAATTSAQERPTYIGLTGLTWGLGTVLGPIVGGGFADSSATWRWAFYINLVIGAVATPVYLLMLPSIDPRPQVTLTNRLRELDYVGALLIMGAFISGTMAISFGGILYDWNSGRIIALFVVSGVLFIVFGLQQTFAVWTTMDRRIFPVHFLRRRTLVLLFALTAAAVTTLMVPIYFVPLYFQFVKADSALMAGVRLLPFVAFLVFAVVLNGVLMSLLGYYMPWYLFGGVFTVIGSALMYTVDENSSVARVYGYTILLGLGAGAFIQTAYSVAQAKVKEADIPLAVGFITCGQIGGATIALSIANSVFLNESTKGVSRLFPGLSTDTVRDAIAGRGSELFATLSGDVRGQVIKAIVDALQQVYILAITAGAMAIVLSLFLKREKLFLQAGGAG